MHSNLQMARWPHLVRINCDLIQRPSPINPSAYLGFHLIGLTSGFWVSEGEGLRSLMEGIIWKQWQSFNRYILLVWWKAGGCDESWRPDEIGLSWLRSTWKDWSRGLPRANGLWLTADYLKGVTVTELTVEGCYRMKACFNVNKIWCHHVSYIICE